jgi:hypothetical protein
MQYETDLDDQRAYGTPAAVDEAVFEQLMDQLGDSDGELRHELIDTYLKEGGNQARDAVVAASNRDPAAFGRSAHALRSTSSLIGATTLADMLLQAEAVARDAPDGLGEVAEPISAEYSRVAVSLALLDTGPPGSALDEPQRG